MKRQMLVHFERERDANHVDARVLMRLMPEAGDHMNHKAALIKERTKHIEIDIHFVRDLVATEQVRILHVPSRFQYADIFTKGLLSALFDEFRDNLSKEMHFLLTTLKVVYVLTTPMPELVEDATVEAIRIRANWENDDYICRGHILNGMSDSLFDVYTNVESAKELWDSLESKYMAEDSSSKKFLGKEVGGASVNTIEEGKNKHNKQNRGKKQSNENNSGSSSNKKPKLECWKCGKTGKFKWDCRSDKKNNPNACGSGKGSKDQSQDQGQNLVHVWNGFIKYFVSLISEAFYVQVDAIAWWIDSGATTHVYKDRCWFKTFEPVEDEFGLYMGDEHFAPIHGKGSVALEFSFGKTVTLFNVLYVPKLRKNLVSGHVLNKCGYKQVYESDKYILSKSDLSEGFWVEAMLMACYLLNRVLNKRNKTTPYELWYKKRPDLSFLQVWGCRAVVRLSDSKRKTLGEKGIDCIFVGYVEHSNAYSIEEDPRTYNESMQSRDAAFWKEVYDDEIGCKWIFKRKMTVDGTIDKFKARLVIQGFRQKKGIDYFDTYAPVARITTIRLLLALAAIHNLVIHQMDVKTTFLNGDLDEEVYMKQPKGFVMPNNEHKVYMGEVDVILGINIKRENKGIVITQSHYIEKILKKFNREDCSPASKKQTCITGSTMESEFVALAAAGKEVEWLRNLIHEIPIWPKPLAPIFIRCDSAPTMARVYSQIYNGKSRHLGVRHSMVKELVRNGVISIEFVRTQHDLADHLTKCLARDLVNKSVKGMGLKSK
nr:retrovirus-related Pol polyprotein from transposon TNT 1-94 [Tanacetum cinerariifolium]